MERRWWKECVVYQVYPRSFMDSNGDGIGDLRGIIAKLDYLKELGIDIIWLSPVYKSPNDDNGYDISDYRDIMDEFGTMQDWEELLAEVHKRGMKLIMDLVANHTSDEHPWFIESRSSKDNPYRDYYIWRPGKDGKEPNNWESIFSGSAWQYDPQSDEYYLHLFSKKQPDLNWENPQVRREIYAMMTWWLDKGIDGFRVDAISHLKKKPGLPDLPNPEGKRYVSSFPYHLNQPGIHDWLQEMKREVLSKYDIMTVGETPGVSPKEALLYVDEEQGEFSMLIQFEHMDLDAGPGGKFDLRPWKLVDLKRVMSKWQTELEGRGWNSLYFENHDQPRSVSRFGNDKEYRVESAKMLATCLHMMQGTPYVYQGQEIGMTNVQFASIDAYQDVEILNYYREAVKDGKDPAQLMQAIWVKGRDNARTPMQWDDSEHAGFTTGTPWLSVNPDYREINVKRALEDPNSIFHYYKKLIQLRKQYPVIVYGHYELLLPEHEQIFAYTRSLGDETLLVITNFSEQTPVFDWPEELASKAKQLLIHNHDVDPEQETEEKRTITLQPYEARVYRLVSN